MNFYKRGRDVRRFLDSTGTVSTSVYFRVLAIGCVDILVTLPIGIIHIATSVTAVRHQGLPFPFYQGWTFTHTGWGPFGLPFKIAVLSTGFWDIFGFYISLWSSVILGFAVFALFGLTGETRATYLAGLRVILGRVGAKTPTQGAPHLSTIAFDSGARGEDHDTEQG